MSSSYVDLSPVVRSINNLSDNLRVVNENVSIVDSKVEHVAREQNATTQRLEQLYEEFTQFVAADIQHKQLQLAQTQIIEVRQMIEKEFGHYDEVRRITTGMLQATDAAIVRQETMRQATENLMMLVPGYWLAPGIVALGAWIADNRPLAEKALAEAIRRDDSKTSLFFALICRRAGRSEANAHWLRRYFQIQNPHQMDREVVVMLDALANGVFGGAALNACSEVVDQWLTELEEQAGFSEEQRKRWANALNILEPKIRDNDYPTLQKYSPTWPKLQTCLCRARRNQVVLSYFEQIFAGETSIPATLESQVDGLLNSLVTNFDEEELPLRRKKRLLELTIEEMGDKTVANRRFDAEADSLEEQTNFAAMLTNAAMNPQQFGATRATQRYAISLSRDWIVNAQNDLAARDRAEVPAQVQLNCGSWTGASSDGSNESSLAADLDSHYANRIDEAVNAVKLTPGAWIALIGGGLMGLVIFAGGAYLVGLVVAAIGAAIFYWQYKNLDRRREDVREGLEKERDQALNILRACLAELVDLRRELTREDAKSNDVTAFLESLTSAQFILGGAQKQRAAIAS
jgi:hypothetical protein